MSWDHPHPFTLPVCPGPADIDGLGHTNNAVYVQWCERVGWAHSEALGLSLADYHRLDRAMAIQRGEYDYLLPTFAGDTLTLATWLMPGDGKLRMERHFQLQRQGPGDSGPITVLRGRWQLVCIAISNGAPKRMPPEFVQAYLPACVTVGC